MIQDPMPDYLYDRLNEECNDPSSALKGENHSNCSLIGLDPVFISLLILNLFVIL